MFEVTNPTAWVGFVNRSTRCGVLFFDPVGLGAPADACIMSQWMMDNLCAGPDTLLKVRLARSTLPRGEYVKLRPHKTAFTDNFEDQCDFGAAKHVLEQALSRGKFSCLTENDTIAIPCRFVSGKNAGKQITYKFDVIEVRPGNSISTIDVDLELDLDPAKDAEEIAAKKKEEAAKKKEEAAKKEEELDEKLRIHAEMNGTKVPTDENVGGWGQTESEEKTSEPRNGYFSNLKAGNRLRARSLKRSDCMYENLPTATAASPPSGSTRGGSLSPTKKKRYMEKIEDIEGRRYRCTYEVDPATNEPTLVRRTPLRKILGGL